MDGSAGQPRVIDLDEAAKLLAMSREGVAALVAAGYLPAARPGAAEFALGDVKALHARMSDDHDLYDVIIDDPKLVDPQALLDALDGRSEEMARRAFDIFQTVFPEAGGWSPTEQARFIDQSRRRFEAILAVTAHGEDVDLASELEQVGAAAAWSGSSLPQLLVVLRISRDLVVQTAVEVSEERGRHWGLALSLLLTRVLPAMDRLTDAVALGYWEAVVGREEESKARYESVVERATDGVYELDLDGCVRYANSALALVLGRRLSELHGARVTDVFVPVEGGGNIEALLSTSSRRSELTIARPDGVRRELVIFTYPRAQGDMIVGFQGIVRDISAETEIESQKNEFLALITHDLRQPLTVVLGLGVTLEGYASELPAERVQRMGTSIRHQAERMARLADDLDAASRIETQALMVNLRPTSLRRTVEDALGTIDSEGVTIEVGVDLVVQADPRRLEQVVANLVENALTHGTRPVVVRAETCGDDVIEITVDDDGQGVEPDRRSTLFTRVRTRGDRDGTRGGGLGLVLVRGLVEAMGGRVWYTERVGGGSSFHLTLSTPRVFAARLERP